MKIRRLLFVILTLIAAPPMAAANQCFDLFDTSNSAVRLDFSGLKITLKNPHMLQGLPPEYQQGFLELVKSMQDLRAGTIDVVQFVGTMADAISRLPKGEQPAWFGPVETFFRLRQGDMTFLNEASDRMLRNEQYTEWLQLVSFAQKASLSPEWPSLGTQTHATWKDFTLRMGLVGIGEIRNLSQGAIQWISAKSLRKHFNKRKNRGELDVASEADLLRLATDFLRAEREGQIVFRQKDDIIIKFDWKTQEIMVINHEGKIITYFTLSDAYRKDQSQEYFLGHFLLGLPYDQD